LLFDALVEHIAEAARHRDMDAREFLLELLDARLVRRGWAAGIEHQRLLGLRFFVELFNGFGARSDCGGQQCDCDAGRQQPSDGRHHERFPVLPFLANDSTVRASSQSAPD
jgi:hypothetical protein